MNKQSEFDIVQILNKILFWKLVYIIIMGDKHLLIL